MATYTIYGDLLFLANFLMDFTLLYGVFRFGNFKTSLGYLLLAALIAAGYGVAAAMPWAGVLTTAWGKCLVSAVIVKTAFPHSPIKLYFRALLYFYLLSFVLAGAVMAISWFFAENQWQGQVLSYTAMALGGGVLLLLLLSRQGLRYVRETLRRNEQVQNLEVVLAEERVSFYTLLDTGNELVDPITRCPVLVAEFEAVAPLLPLAFCDAWRRYPNKDVTELMAEFVHTPLGKRLRLIPFTSIGKKNGLLLGFQPDYIVARGREKNTIATSVICLYRGSLGTKEQCRCIMNPAALKEMKNHVCSEQPLGLGQ